MKNLESQLNHPHSKEIICRNIRCKERGTRLDCYSTYQNCDRYVRWKRAIEIYIRRVELRKYLKEKNKK